MASLLSLVLLVTACTSADDPPTSTTDTLGTTTTSSTRLSDTTIGSETNDAQLPTDLLTFANGAILLNQSGLPLDGSSRALAIFDGSDERQHVSDLSNGSAVIVIELPALTTFDGFRVPNVVDPPGRATLFRDVLIEGSDVSSDGPWTELASGSLEEQDTPFELTVSASAPVRWLRVSLANGLVAESNQSGGRLEFTELVGTGAQDEQLPSDGFTGTWDLRRPDRLDRPGDLIALRQTGSVVTGCHQELELTGTVEGAVARAVGRDPATGEARTYLFVLGDDGQLHAGIGGSNGRFLARRGVPSDDLPPCDAPPPELPGCGATVHIQFAADSAELQAGSGRVLADLFEGLGRDAPDTITIIGHTSTEGTESYNQDLSERRAQAVVDSLVERGFDPEIISAEGRGETEPLVSPELDETARSLNRRVEVSCTP